MNTGFSRFGSNAPVVKNLIYINILMLVLTWVVRNLYHQDLEVSLGLFYPDSSYFRVYQILTHMFMHGGIQHLFFNMFALWMFGRALENAWGSKRFLIYYLLTGLGAAALHTFVNYMEIEPMTKFVHSFTQSPTPALFNEFIQQFVGDPQDRSLLMLHFSNWQLHPEDLSLTNKGVYLMHLAYDNIISIPTVGASGAVYGVLMGFGLLFPNTVLMLIFPPIPVKAKYLVAFFAVVEIYLGISQPGSNIAHFAHIGGMLFGYLIIRYWNSRRTNFY